jgi:hypothetical protein
LCGFTIGGWLMARAAHVAADKLAQGSADREFLDAKLASTHFYATQVLPQTLAWTWCAQAARRWSRPTPR